MSALEHVPTAAGQARALLWLRYTLFRRKLVRERQWVRAILNFVMIFGVGGSLSGGLCLLILETAEGLRSAPGAVASRGGPLAVFATWLTMVLVGRVWLGLIRAGSMESFLDPRRFLLYAVPPRLLSALNLAAQIVEPTWLVVYPVLIAVAVGVSRLPGAPSFWALAFAEVFAVASVFGVLHFAAALGAFFDSRPFLRRGFSVALVFGGFAAFQLSLARPGRMGVAELFAGHHWRVIALTPPGWTAVLAQALSDGRPLHAVTPALLLFLLAAGGALAAHSLSTRELLRPAETHEAPLRGLRKDGWVLPLVPGSFSALFEKEAKTALRIGWLQLVLVPAGFLLLRTIAWQGFVGRAPLLFGAAYAHLGVLDIATNAFGRDVAASRAYFLWPLDRRVVLAAKNAVAYVFSLVIFALISVVAIVSAHATAGQIALGLCAHAATFPLLATYGNVASILFPSPVRGARMRRVRGAGPIGARFFAMALLLSAAWGPWWLAQARGAPPIAFYLGELVVMSIAYGGLLAFSSGLLESRREKLLSALARDE